MQYLSYSSLQSAFEIVSLHSLDREAVKVSDRPR